MARELPNNTRRRKAAQTKQVFYQEKAVYKGGFSNSVIPPKRGKRNGDLFITPIRVTYDVIFGQRFESI